MFASRMILVHFTRSECTISPMRSGEVLTASTPALASAALEAGSASTFAAAALSRASHACRAVIELSGLGFCQRDEIRHAVRGQVAIDDVHAGRQPQQGYRREILLRIIRQLLVEAGAIDQADMIDQRRLAIGG